MENSKLGQFIAEQRKVKKMTQKDLAEKLHITDKAVSKWERGLSCPDISLLSSLAEALDVSIGELLNGEKNVATGETAETAVNQALHYAEKTVHTRLHTWQNIWSLVFSVLLFVAIMVCAICDMAVCGALTWSLYPISAIAFTWLVFFPLIKCGEKGVVWSLTSFSLVLLPFLYVIDRMANTKLLVMRIGIPVTAVAVAFLWLIFAIFRIWKLRKLFATGVMFLLAIPMEVLMNLIIFRILGEPWLDVWDMIGIALMVIFAAVFFVLDYKKRR